MAGETKKEKKPRPEPLDKTKYYRTRRRRIDGMLDLDSGGKVVERKPKHVEAGPAPWNTDYEGFKHVNKSTLKKQRIYQTTAGYVQTQKRPAKLDKRTITLANGRKATIIDSHLGVPLGYQGPSSTAYDENGLSSEEYAARAFDGKHKTYTVEGCGHIAELEYSAYYQLLKVKFVNGDGIVIYYRVPSAVFGELYHLALQKTQQISTVDGTQRHTLGIRFWDLIRIRGTLHGSRYRFEYRQENVHTGGKPGRPLGSGIFASMEADKIRGSGLTKIRVYKEDVIRDWEDADIEDYFEYGNYDSHIAKVKTERAKKYLHEAYNKYMNMADKEDIKRSMLAAYSAEPKSFTFITEV